MHETSPPLADLRISPQAPSLPLVFFQLPGPATHRLTPLGSEIQEFLRSGQQSNCSLSAWGSCLRAAVGVFIAARRFRLPPRLLIAVGRLHFPNGSAVDHAWVLVRSARSWRVLDVSLRISGVSYEPLLLISTGAMWAVAPPHVINVLRPQFFLTVHCQINDSALKRVLDPTLIDDINRMNARVDDPLVHPNYDPREHFDNTLIRESITLLEDRLHWDGESPLDTVAAGAHQAAAYGLACHAVADFYAHSNYAAIALAYTKDPKTTLTLDDAVADHGFLDFVSSTWTNASMWSQHDGYGTPLPPAFSDAFSRCLFTGGYGGDGWIPRADVPHHNVFAVDAPDSALVHAPEIQRRQNPFAYPGEWQQQFNLRRALAKRHVQNAMKRAKSGDPNPFLGSGRNLPESLVPPPWTRNAAPVADAFPLPTRGFDGWLVSGNGGPAP